MKDKIICTLEVACLTSGALHVIHSFMTSVACRGFIFFMSATIGFTVTLSQLVYYEGIKMKL